MDSDKQLLQQLVAGQGRIEEKLDRLLGIFDDDAQPVVEDTGPDSRPLETGKPK